jgi:nucleotide-binding universal stress UspA family protein
MAMRANASAGTPLRRVLVATDFSRHSLWAVERAAMLPLASGARVLICHAVHGAPTAKSARRSRGFHEARLRQVAQRFTAVAQGRGLDNLRVETEITEGTPFVEIIRQARRIRAQLIVVGRHGKRAVRDLLLGTTAKRVMRKGRVSVLIVNQRPRVAYRRPLIGAALDPSDRQVVLGTLALLEESVGDIAVLHACHVPFEGWIFMGASGQDRASYRRTALVQSARQMNLLVRGFGSIGIRLTPLVRLGDPRTVIDQAAERRRADLLAVGSHGRSGVARVLLGEVAERVATVSVRDVLVVSIPGITLRLP